MHCTGRPPAGLGGAAAGWCQGKQGRACASLPVCHSSTRGADELPSTASVSTSNSSARRNAGCKSAESNNAEGAITRELSSTVKSSLACRHCARQRQCFGIKTQACSSALMMCIIHKHHALAQCAGVNAAVLSSQVRRYVCGTQGSTSAGAIGDGPRPQSGLPGSAQLLLSFHFSTPLGFVANGVRPTVAAPTSLPILSPSSNPSKPSFLVCMPP